MPYSHLHRMSKEKLESTTRQRMTTNCFPDPASVEGPDADFSELVWQNGQVSMQTNKTRRSLSIQEKVEGRLPNDDWVDYPLEDYSSHFFSEFNQNFAVPVLKDAQPGSSHSIPSYRSKVIDSTDCNTNFDREKEKCSHNNYRPLGHPNKNASATNFSHFLRSNRPNVDGSSSLGVDKGRVNEKGSVVSGSNQVQSTTIVSTIESRGVGRKPNASLDVKRSVAMPPIKKADRQGDTPVKGKCVDPVVASSSVCSANVASGASSDLNNRFKRKYSETEESDYPSEDVEEESVGVRKPVTARPGSSAKRTRAAEVHNLSERRRRDRINEKMRALQELIPNCNKVDKASMLDEAIEYLKTLQIQVQMMSMGTGMFIPPMGFPRGMQHLNAPHLTPFSPVNAGMGIGMGLGMGMGMNFGMGMLDLTGGSAGCPLIPMPPIHGQHFPYTPMSGSPSLSHLAGSNLQMFAPPGQRIPVSMSPSPFIPTSGGVSINPNSLPIVSEAAIPTEVPNLTTPSCSKDTEEYMNEPVPNANAEGSEDHRPAQATKENSGLPAVEHTHDQPPQSNGNIVVDTA